MPKKFKGENSKATVAKARKAAIQEEKLEQKRKEEEDAYWADDDKQVNRKLQRKEEKEKKRIEAVEKKHELKKLADDEMESIKAKDYVPPKLTRAQIEQQRELEIAAAAAARRESELVHTDMPLEENVNRLEVDGDEARTITEAISVLNTKEKTMEKHPEKRVKAAYLEFEEQNLPILKKENPNLRLSQLKQILKKDWLKSPENPLNQRHAAYNEKT